MQQLKKTTNKTQVSMWTRLCKFEISRKYPSQKCMSSESGYTRIKELYAVLRNNQTKKEDEYLSMWYWNL